MNDTISNIEIYSYIIIIPRFVNHLITSYSYLSIYISLFHRIDRMKEWLKNMETIHHVQPLLFHYNAVLTYLGKHQLVEEVETIFNYLKENPSLFPLDNIIYNAVLDSVGRVGQLDKVHLYFQEMKAKGIQPDTIIFHTIIHWMSHHQRSEEVLFWFEEMKKSGVPLDQTTYATLLTAFARDSLQSRKNYHNMNNQNSRYENNNNQHSNSNDRNKKDCIGETKQPHLELQR